MSRQWHHALKLKQSLNTKYRLKLLKYCPISKWQMRGLKPPPKSKSEHKCISALFSDKNLSDFNPNLSLETSKRPSFLPVLKLDRPLTQGKIQFFCTSTPSHIKSFFNRFFALIYGAAQKVKNIVSAGIGSNTVFISQIGKNENALGSIF